MAWYNGTVTEVGAVSFCQQRPILLLTTRFCDKNGKGNKMGLCLGAKMFKRKLYHKFIDGFELKRCSTCKEWKTISSFGVHIKEWDGLQRECIDCRHHRYRENKINVSIKNREYVLKHQEETKRYKAEWYQRNRERYAEKAKEYLKNKREEINKYHKKYYNIRYKTDMNFRLRISIAARINRALHYNAKKSSTILLLGCSIDNLKLHLESMFDENMNWENYGTYWHIDHIIPCAAFNLSDVEEQKKCFHHTNLQPLEAIENIKKGKKIYV